jgi:AcrR family transcriptional regulator
MKKSASQSSELRILDAAEKAFADSGFAGASLRQIVSRAGVNLPTVYYYFGSKEGLMMAVIDRRLGPLRQEQLDRLRQFEAEARGRPLAVEKILEAMLLPPLRLATTASAKRQAVMRLIGRIVTEPNPQTQEVLRSRHELVRSACLAALQRSRPDIPLCDLRWRLEFVWGALAFILCNPRRLEKETHGVCDPINTKAVLAQMIACFSAGFQAPAVT